MLDRKRSLHALPPVVSLGCLLVAMSASGCKEAESGGCLNTVPYKSGWTQVLKAPFAYAIEGENAPLNVAELIIGGQQSGGNFINRGDIEVYYTLPPDPTGIGEIIVEMNKFTFACDDAEAFGDGPDNPGRFSRIQPWIYASGSLVPPGDPALTGLECDATNGFLAGCRIRLYYDGQNQPIRDGADIRVFLPSDYAGSLLLTTDDNTEDSTYLDRSNITVDGLQGQLAAVLDSGVINVRIADDAIPAPNCGADNNTACEEYIDPVTGDPNPWSTDCPCSAENLNSIKIDSRGNESMNATVDAPPSYWTVATLNNTDELNSIATGDFCEATIDCSAFDACETSDVDCSAEKPWRCKGNTNTPSGAIAGTGVTVNVTSDGCGTVQYHEGPNDYNTAPSEQKRGLIEFCSGCLDGVIDVPSPS